MPTADWEPTVNDVGAILRTRTRDSDGLEVGTFTSDTRPTQEQVESLIAQGVADVAMRIGSDIPSSVWQDAKAVAALATSLRVELTYFPEQINSGRSPYPQLKELYDGGSRGSGGQIQALIAAVTQAGGDPGEAGAPSRPAYAFPMLGDPLIIGRGTQW